MYYTNYPETKAKVHMKLIFQSQGSVEMAETWLHENVNSPLKTVSCEKIFLT